MSCGTCHPGEGWGVQNQVALGMESSGQIDIQEVALKVLW